MEDLNKAYELLITLTPIITTMTYEAFLALSCMLLEEWGKANERDVIELSNDMNLAIKKVVEVEGRY